MAVSIDAAIGDEGSRRIVAAVRFAAIRTFVDVRVLNGLRPVTPMCKAASEAKQAGGARLVEATKVEVARKAAKVEIASLAKQPGRRRRPSWLKKQGKQQRPRPLDKRGEARAAEKATEAEAARQAEEARLAEVATQAEEARIAAKT